MLPGLGPIGAIALLFPVVYVIDTSSALMLLASVYYRAQYGGSTAAILMNTPGPPPPRSRPGMGIPRRPRAAPACGAHGGRPGSFAAGLFATVALVVLAAPLAAASARFSSVELFALCVLVLVGSVVLSSGSLLKSFGMILLGMLLAAGGHRRGHGRPALHGRPCLAGAGRAGGRAGDRLVRPGQILAQLSNRRRPRCAWD